MGRPKKVRPMVKVGIERAKDLGVKVFDFQIGPRDDLTVETWQQMLSIWARVQGEFLPRPDRLAGSTFEDPHRCGPGNRPWMWWAERGLPKPIRDGEELLELKRLSALVEGEWEAARSQLQHMAMNHWTSEEERNAAGTAEWLGLPLAWVHEWWAPPKPSGSRENGRARAWGE